VRKKKGEFLPPHFLNPLVHLSLLRQKDDDASGYVVSGDLAAGGGGGGARVAAVYRQ
jgi:hypothetical protein